MPEFSKIMKNCSSETSIDTTMERESATIYKNTFDLLSGVYQNLVKETPQPISIDILRKTISDMVVILRKMPEDMLILSHARFPETEYIPRHALNVSIIALEVGIKFELANSELENLGIASLLHCVGRPAGTEREIILEAKYLKIRSEYLDSVKSILSAVKGISDRVVEIIENHHSVMDNNAFPFKVPPDGEKWKDAEKVLVIADTYCTMLNLPMVEKGYYPYTALMQMIEHGGNLFKREILKSLIDIVGLYPIGSWIELSSGEIGEVIKTNLGLPMRPIVKIMFGAKENRLVEPKFLDVSEEALIHIKRVIYEAEIDELLSGDKTEKYHKIKSE